MTFPRQSALRAAMLALAVPVTTLAVPMQAAQAQSGDVAAVSRALRAITTLKANFEQTNATGSVARGTLLLKQPGKVRFDYGKNDLLIVSDGRSLNMIDYSVKQVSRYPVRNSPLGPLLDPTRDLTRYGKIVPSGSANLVAIEARDKDHPEYGTMTLYFERKASAPGGLELTGWLMRDAQGNRTTVRFSNISYGGAIADSAFTWRDPRPNPVGPRR